MESQQGSQPLQVWAPGAREVGAAVGLGDGTTYAMVPTPHRGVGWWSTEQRFPAGTRYAFSIDGGVPRPDPRSLSQPDGVHEPSELVDLATRPWQDNEWSGLELQGSVIYELHIGTFTPEGTLDSAIERLDHLVELGVSMVELMPVAAFPGRHGWGYDGVSLYAVHAPYGGSAALQRFVDAAHTRGLAVCLDVVHNHLGPSGNYLSVFGPYFTDRHHTPWGDAVNLDGPGSDGVREFLCDNVRLWLEDFHMDALRLDAVHALRDDRALHLLEELSTVADEITQRTGVPRALIAESDRNDPATVSHRGPGGAGGMGLHGQWSDDVHHALHVALTGEVAGYYADFADPEALPKVLGRTPFFHDGTYSSFRGRRHGRRVDQRLTPPWRYVASLQTHDQVGNRAVGERLSHLAPAGVAAAGAALLLTAPYTPMLFMGEEWAASTPWQFFTDHSEPELAEAIRVGRRAEFAEHGWSATVPDPQAEATVTASRLDWAELDQAEHARMLAWYRTLLRLRRERADLREAPLGRDLVRYDAARHLVTVRRGRLVVVANLGAEEAELATPPEDGSRIQQRILAAWGEVSLASGGIHLPAHSVAIVG